eukprot:4820876-Pleurochrysis_carterae.AAC.1
MVNTARGAGGWRTRRFEGESRALLTDVSRSRACESMLEFRRANKRHLLAFRQRETGQHHGKSKGGERGRREAKLSVRC